jgi:pimeloyl-ACP methyl ester carboxylesterase
MLTAARSPERVRSLCLIEPAAHALARDQPNVAAEIAIVDRLLLRAPGLTPRQLLVERPIRWDRRYPLRRTLCLMR